MPRKRKTTEEFIRESQQRFGDRYTYGKTRYTHSQTPVIITCRRHGTDIEVRPYVHLHKGQACLRCERMAHIDPERNIAANREMADAASSLRILASLEEVSLARAAAMILQRAGDDIGASKEDLHKPYTLDNFPRED